MSDSRTNPDVRSSLSGRSRAALELLGLAAWIGLITGYLELAILVVWHACAASTVLGALQMNRHYCWMIPVVHLLVLSGCGLPVALLALSRPVLARSLAIRLLGTLALYAVFLMVPGFYPVAAALVALGLGHRLFAPVAALGGVPGRIVWFSLPVLFLGLAVLGALNYDQLVLEERRALSELPPAAPSAPNVLLIVLDTVRADHLSLYGYGRETTPNLARLARRGVVFDEARSAAPWTLPSHASLFTGRWPHELGVSVDRPLDATYPTLAEFLSRHGYATAGFVGNTYFCNSWYGLARGFAHYEDYYEANVIVSPSEMLRCAALGRWLIRLVGTAGSERPEATNTPKDAERVNHDFLRWIAAHRDRPFFAFLNYMDAHDPYLTPPGFDQHFGVKPESAADLDKIRNWHLMQRKRVPDRDAALIRDAYDDCLAYLDQQLGQLFDSLERTGVLRDTLVILTSDHGEQLGGHGLFGHGKSLYREELHVPLLVFGPTGIPAGRTVAEPVSLRDVAATIAERLGLAENSPLPGCSLARCWDPVQGHPPEGGSAVFSEVAVKTRASKNARRIPALRGPMESLVTEGKVYIRDAAGREELYDLAGDPAEDKNLAGSERNREVLERCRFALERIAPRGATRH